MIFEILTKFLFKRLRLQKFCLGVSELLKLNPDMKNVCKNSKFWRQSLSQSIKATVQEQNPLSSFHQRFGATMDRFLELIAGVTEFGANEILIDTRETRREDQFVLSTACQEEQHIILPITAHHQEEHKLTIYVIFLTL